MKKILIGLLIGVVVISLILGGCAKSEPAPGAPAPSAAPVPTAAPAPAPKPAPKPAPTSAPAAGKTIVWKAASDMTASNANSEIRWWAEEMEKRTNGQFKVKFYWGGQLGREPTYPEGLKTGLYEMADVVALHYTNAMPISNMAFLPGVPPDDFESYSKFLFALQEYQPYKDELAQFNMVPVVDCLFGPYELMGNKKVKTTSDLKGLRVRLGPPKGSLYSYFGASLTMIPGTEVYDALSRGILDMASFSWTNAYVRQKIYEISKYATINTGAGPLHHSWCSTKEAWDALPAEFKSISKELTAQIPAQVAAPKFVDEMKKDLVLFEQRKIEVFKFSDADRAKMDEAARITSEAYLKAIEGQGKPVRKWYDWLLAKKAEIEAAAKKK